MIEELDCGYQMVCSVTGIKSVRAVVDWLAEQVGFTFDNGHVITMIEQFQIIGGTGPYYNVVAVCRVEKPLENGGGKFESNTLNEAYFDRNQTAMLAAKLAHQSGMRVGWRENTEDPDWPILFIELPTGQVSWHIPLEECPLGLALAFGGHDEIEWDGHNLKMKRDRILQYLDPAAIQNP